MKETCLQELSGEDIRVVYYRETGTILHIHRSMAIPGVKLPKGKVLHAAALDIALKNSGESAEKLDVLSVREEDYRPGTRYKVDLQRRCMVEEKEDYTTSAE